MTTTSHLNDFVKPDPENLEELSKTADNLLKVEHLDLDNAEYLAKVLFYLERHDESIKEFEKLLSLKGDDVLIFIGINHFRKGDYEDAVECFDKSLEKSPDNETALTYKMLCHEFLGSYADAIECGERILKGNCKNDQIISRMIDYHLRLKNYDAALYYIGQMENEDSYRKAQILYDAKRYEECIDQARKIRTAESYRLAGKAYHKLQNTLKAVRYLFKSYEMDFSIDTLFEISEIYFELNEYARSVYFLKQVLIHDELNAEAHSRIAAAYLESKNWHDAIEYAQKTIEINAKVPKAYITLAEANFQLLGSDFLDNVIQILDRGISENPESAELWAKRGGYIYPYDMPAVRYAYEKALELNPNDRSLFREYIFLLLMDEDEETAKRFYNKMLLFNPLYDKSFEELKRRCFWVDSNGNDLRLLLSGLR